MMIVGTGSDLANISRIENTLAKYGPHFMNKIFTKAEMAEMNKRKNVSKREFACMVTKRFAAKEACSKALGTGFREGVFWKNIEIRHLPSGKPTLRLSGGALKHAQNLCEGGNINLHVSMSDDYPWAQAFVVLEKI